MYSYSILQWILFFYIYCFLGWIIETTYVSVKTARLVNRGFLNGPVIPIYGFGALIILVVVLPVRTNPLLVFLLGMTAATLLELATGFVMEKIYKMRYWNYSNSKFNFYGYICLFCSICWGILSLLLVFVVHSLVEKLVLGLGFTALVAVVSALSSLFVVDCISSSKTAMELRNLLVHSERLKNDIIKLHNTMVEWNDKAEANKRLVLEFKENMSSTDMYNAVRGSFIRLREDCSSHIPNTIEETMNSISDKYKAAVFELDKRKAKLLSSNPSASSNRFGKILDEFKNTIKNR
jgi:uncharacterized membrane protein